VPSVLVGLDTPLLNRSTSFHSLSDHSMSAAEKRKTPIPLLVNTSVASAGVRGWHLIRSRAAMIFCLTIFLVALISPLPVPQYPRYLHASSRIIASRVSPLIVKNGAGSCSLRFLSLIYYQQIRFLHIDLHPTPGRKFLHNV